MSAPSASPAAGPAVADPVGHRKHVVEQARDVRVHVRMRMRMRMRVRVRVRVFGAVIIKAGLSQRPHAHYIGSLTLLSYGGHG